MNTTQINRLCPKNIKNTNKGTTDERSKIKLFVEAYFILGIS
jgi:hypothetical protein